MYCTIADYDKNGIAEDAQKLMAEVTHRNSTSHVCSPPTSVMYPCANRSCLRNQNSPMWRMLQLNDINRKCEDLTCKLTCLQCSHAAIWIMC